MKLLMQPGKEYAKHKRRTLRRGNEVQSQTRASMEKMDVPLLSRDVRRLNCNRNKSNPYQQGEGKSDVTSKRTLKSLVQWCSEMKGK